MGRTTAGGRAQLYPRGSFRPSENDNPVHDLNGQVAPWVTGKWLIIELDSREEPVAQIWHVGTRDIGALSSDLISKCPLRMAGFFIYPLSDWIDFGSAINPWSNQL